MCRYMVASKGSKREEGNMHHVWIELRKRQGQGLPRRSKDVLAIVRAGETLSLKSASHMELKQASKSTISLKTKLLPIISLILDHSF